jgi:hypothetical protein
MLIERRPRGDGEAGLTIVIVTLALLVLMIFAAFAIDMGAAYNERRQDQSAADAGVLAAARRVANGEGRAVAVAEALEISREDVDSPRSVAAWAADFLSDCPETPPAGYTATPATPCVSFSFNNQRVRVHMPDMEVRSSFARVLGIDFIHTSAFAEAGLRIAASSDILPYGLPGASANGNEVCIKVVGGQLDNLDPIDHYPYGGCGGDENDPASGNFRRLDAAIYGNFDMGTATISNVPYCPPGGSGLNADDVVAINTAFGIDHILTRHPAPNTNADDHPADIDDWGRCPDFGAGPNLVHTQTGTTSSGLTRGLSAANVASSGRAGRLVGATSYTTEVVRSGNPPWEVAPLWEFIDPLETDLPPICKRASFDDTATDATLLSLGVPVPPPWRSLVPTTIAPYPIAPSSPAERGNESKAHMLLCLTAYAAGTGFDTLFGLDTDGDPDNRLFDIQTTNRFGFVPVLAGEAESNEFRIDYFAPVYLDTAYFQCNAFGCNYYHGPGESSRETLATPIPNPRTMDALSAYFLQTAGVLPVEIIEDAPGQRSNLVLELVK